MTEKKTIWYLHHYAGSPQRGMSFRPYYLAKEFNKLGMNAFVIAASNHHLLKHQPHQQENVKHEIVEDVPYLWVKTPKYQGNGLWRILNMFAYGFQIRRFEKQICAITGKPDFIIVSSSHPLHFPVSLKLAKKYQAKIIFEVRDIWPLSLIELLNVNRYHPFILWLKCIEKFAYKNSDAIVSVLKGMDEYLRNFSLKYEGFYYIPNGISDIELGYNSDVVNALDVSIQEKLNQLKLEKKFIIGYAGAHGVPNALAQFIEAMVFLNKNNAPIHAILIGNGLEKNKLMQTCFSYNIRNISFFDSIPKTQINSFLQQVDAAYIGWLNLPIYQYGISPNKIFDYMLAGKPIIHATNTPFDPVQIVKCGYSCPAENPILLAEIIKKMSQLSEEELFNLGQNGKTYVINKHSYAFLSSEYLRLFDKWNN